MRQMKSAYPPIVVMFAASFAHVLLIILGMGVLQLSVNATFFLTVVPAFLFGVVFGTYYGFVSLWYGIFFFIVFLTIGPMVYRYSETFSGELIVGSSVVIFSHAVGAVPAAIVRSTR